MKGHETRSHAHSRGDEEKMVTRKQKAEGKTHEAEHSPKKSKSKNDDDGHFNGKSTGDFAAEFDNFCKAVREHLSVDVVARCESFSLDIMFYGALDKCVVCGSTLESIVTNYYSCNGDYSEWSTCSFNTTDPPRVEELIKLPESVQKPPVSDLTKNHHKDRKRRPKRDSGSTYKPFAGMVIALSGRLSQTHQYWKSKIEKHGGKVSNSVSDAACLVVSPTERERLVQSCSSDLVDSRGIPWNKKDPSDVALESVVAEVKVSGKRGVHKDSKLQEQGGQIFEKDGILNNCAFSLCDLRRLVNDICVMQLIMVPNTGLHLYYTKGRASDGTKAEERLEERENVDGAVKEFAKLFQELTGNEFEPWEREKKFQKKPRKFYPVDMGDGVNVRHGGIGLQQKGVAVAHCKLDPFVANFVKVLCSQEIYRYALVEMGLDSPDLPMAMLSDVHLKRCEAILLQYVETVKTRKETRQKARAVWLDFSMKWFTLLHSTRPFIFHDYNDLAHHKNAWWPECLWPEWLKYIKTMSFYLQNDEQCRFETFEPPALESVRDIMVASHLKVDMSGPTLDDPLIDTINWSYGVSVDKIFAAELSACPSYDEIKKMPNKALLWCGTQSSNLLRHLHKGLLPSICSLPVPGYMLGRAIICSDAAAEAVTYGFTAVDRPDGFLVLAIASLGEQITKYNRTPEAERSEDYGRKEGGGEGIGRKKTDESEHFVWKDDIEVPRGRLAPSEHKDSPLKYNEYAAYDPNLVSIRFLVAVKYEEQGVKKGRNPGSEKT
ncbi:unnamed protein product [Camellia sinensis]